MVPNQQLANVVQPVVARMELIELDDHFVAMQRLSAPYLLKAFSDQMTVQP